MVVLEISRPIPGSKRGVRVVEIELAVAVPERVIKDVRGSCEVTVAYFIESDASRTNNPEIRHVHVVIKYVIKNIG